MKILLPVRIGVTLLAAMALSLFATGCRMLSLPSEAVRAVTPDKKDNEAADPVEMQQTLLRLADEFTTRMTVGVEQLRRDTTPLEPAEVLRWKIIIGTEINSIVSGPNALANVLDMTALITVTRMALEEHWQPKVFGESALPLVAASRAAETNVWRLTDRIVVQPAHQEELRAAIEKWFRENPLSESILATRAIGFTSRFAPKQPAKDPKSGGLFDLFEIDPLASLDPAMREIAQSRLFAERALYLAHRMPTLLRWQMELLALDAARMPTVQQLVTNSTQFTAALAQVARVAEQIPMQLSIEREEILKALQSQEKGLAALAAETRETLNAGAQMASNLTTTLKTFDALMERFGVGKTNTAAPRATNAQPFRIQDYGEAAARIEVTAARLTELLRTFDQTLSSTNLTQLAAQATPVVQQAQATGKEIVDHAFRRILWLIAALCGGIFVMLVGYRFFAARLTHRSKNA